MTRKYWHGNGFNTVNLYKLNVILQFRSEYEIRINFQTKHLFIFLNNYSSIYKTERSN